MELLDFYTGRSFDAYKYLGAHVEETGTVFRTFAPAAKRVALIASCTGWQELPMERTGDGNFWTCRVAEAAPGTMYKYRIYTTETDFIDHCDPYGFGMELRPNTASIVRRLDGYTFGDGGWMRARTDCKAGPLNIYEVHLGSFKKPGAAPDSWYTYREIAERLVPYVKEQGYNYIEIMPLGEYPSDESWGYQATGFFSPTARYGTLDELKYLVDACHRSGIGVLLDFVPVHFAVDGYALARYDGTALYEYPHADVGSSEWGSCNFMHSRGEVRSFLQSAANYWLEEFHIDGLRMDAISRMIYWQGDPARGVNGAAVEFLRGMNRGLKALHPTAMLCAEDSTAYPGVTEPAEAGGLGFDYKWDMGWMNDTLDYFRTAPEYRSRDYHKLTFSMAYYYGDRFLLPFSHDENVHGKATVLQKMYGDYAGKFPQGRALYLYMYAHPGKKLNFMGGELGQLREWDEKREQDWMLLQYPIHDAFNRMMRDLNRLYLGHPALWAADFDPAGFCWIDCHQEEKCVYALERTGGGERIAAVFNFSDRAQDYALKLPGAASLEVLIDSDWDIYGGKKPRGADRLTPRKGAFALKLAPFSGMYCRIHTREKAPIKEKGVG